MTRSIQPVLLLGVLVLATACQKDSTPIRTTSAAGAQVSPAAEAADARGHSLVRVVNATSDGKSVSVGLGDMQQFADVKTGIVTDYREVDDRMTQFSVSATTPGSGAIPVTKAAMLLDGMRYTAFVITQDVSTRAVRVVRDDVIPDSGKARLRVVHAAPGGPEFDVRAAGNTDKLFAGVNFTSEAGYTDLAPTTMSVEIRAAGEDRVLLRIPSMQLRRGTSTTIVVTGSGKLSFFVFNDAMMKQVVSQ